MAITDLEIWSEAENTCFEFLTGKTGDKAEETAFIGYRPVQSYNIWFFEIQGGDAPLDYDFNMDTKGGCGEWKMNAQVTGYFTERDSAQRLACILRSELPIEESSLTNIFRFRPRSEPTLEREAIETEGVFVQLWRLTYELEVIIKQ